MNGRTSPTSFLKHATDVASFYGFSPARDIERLAHKQLKRAQKVRGLRTRGAHSFTTSALAASSCVSLRPNEPALAFYATPLPNYLPLGVAPREVGEFGLQVIGSQGSVSEVVLLKTLSAIITEWGSSVARVRVNALGDKDSKQRFSRELSVYLRKRSEDFAEECRIHTASNPLLAYTCTHETCRAVLQEGPRAMSFLSEKSRVHFRSVLEHLENLSLPYELDDLLMGDDRDAHISFAIDLKEQDGTIVSVSGGRYDEFFRRHTGHKDAPGVAASIYFRKKGAARANFVSPAPSRAPKIYFVQLGTRAKLQGLSIVDMLREAHIPVSQSFDASHLSPQLSAAKELGVSYMLIMGQREAIDGTVIVRSTANSSQKIMEVSELPRFLKTLQK